MPWHHHVYDDVIKWKHFPRYSPFVRGIRRPPVNSPHKCQWRVALMFFFDLCLNKRLSKQLWAWWFETPSHLLWRHRYDIIQVQWRWMMELLWENSWAIRRRFKQWPSVRMTRFWSQVNIAEHHLTHWGRDKVALISQTTSPNAFSWMKMFEFLLEFHRSLFPMLQLTINSIGSDNGLSPSRRQAIIWTNDG